MPLQRFAVDRLGHERFGIFAPLSTAHRQRPTCGQH